MRRRAALLLGLLLASCGPRTPPPEPVYLVGAPYQAGGVWRYPRESFDYDETGLAVVVSGPSGRSGLTADGEAFDATALAAGHRSLQLPALLRVTNLENGRQLAVRANDRGPADPARLLAITRRTAELLGVADPRAVRVRVQVMEAESRQLAMELQSRMPATAVAQAAPSGGVQAEALAPPPGAASRAPRRVAALPSAPATAAPVAPAPIPQRLAEHVVQVGARPGSLAIDCGSFGRPEYAEIMRARLANLGARTTTSYAAPRDRAYLVRISGLGSVAQAEAMLARALAQGVADARIVVE